LNWLLLKLGVAEYLLYSILIGLGITVIAKIFRGMIHREDFYINGRLFFWIILNTLGFMLIRFVIDNVHIQEFWISALLIGLGISLVGKIGRMIKIGSGHNSFHFPNMSFGVVIFIIVILIILANVIYLPYKTVPLSTYNTYCEGDKVMLKNNMMGLGNMAFQMEAGVTCLEYTSSRCRFTCQNQAPVCSCEAKVFDRIFHSPGDWIFGQ
jgi:hypothetical protein